jgi:hypothetical protein
MAHTILQEVAFSVIGILIAIESGLQLGTLILVLRFGGSSTLLFWSQVVSFYIMLGLALCLLFGGANPNL